MNGGRVPSGDFSAQARFYARARPPYPDAALDRLLREAQVAAGGRALDLGAGTGLCARALARRGLDVTAVEPNRAMRAAARPHPRVRFVAGRFEALGFRRGAFDLAVAAQSFHWADAEPALAEIHRVLPAGGCLAALWNERRYEAHPFLSWTWATIRRRVPEFHPVYRGRDWASLLCASGRFRTAAVFSVEHEVTMDRRRYLDLWRSHHRLSEIAGRERLARLVEEIAARWPAGGGVLRVPYRCRVFVVRRVEVPGGGAARRAET